MSLVSIATGEHRSSSSPSGTPDPAGSFLLNPGARIDERYEVVRGVGQGGMGRVVEVVRRDDGRRLALKYSLDRPLARRRLVREARILGDLRHPHLVPVIDANLDHDPPYFVMPLAEGSLDDELRERGGELPWAFSVFRQVCLGVQALHRAAIVHRDLKPANILRLADGTYAVADLGTAKREPRDSTILTRTCAILGTLHYLAPEQLMPAGTREADARTDIYQLGKILYQLVSGRSPAMVDPGCLPHGLGRIVARATAFHPDDRYPDVAALLESVDQWQLGSHAGGPSRSLRTLEVILREMERRTSREHGESLDGDAILDVLAGTDRLRDDEALEAFDALPTPVISRLALEFGGRFRGRLRAYGRCLERGSGRRSFAYADFVAGRMGRLIADRPSPEILAQAVEVVLIVAVVLNRYSAMGELKQILYRIRGVDEALAVAEMLRERRELLQEIAPYLRIERLHPILRGVVDDLDWVETVSF